MNNKGFISITLVITVTGLLLALSFSKTIAIAHFFDQTRTKEYRLMNHYNALSCIDQAILNLSYDFYYRVSTSTQMVDFDCSIDRVDEKNGVVTIDVTGNYMNIDVKMTSQVRLFDSYLEIVN